MKSNILLPPTIPKKVEMTTNIGAMKPHKDEITKFHLDVNPSIQIANFANIWFYVLKIFFLQIHPPQW